jgi:protocatechuate 3,4-dioxygenase beta subunit
MERPDNRRTLARRLLLGGLAGTTLAPLAPVARVGTSQSGSRAPSPTQTLGPFYPRNAAERPRATDADLITVEGGRVLTKGVPIHLIGRVVDRRGIAVNNAAVEIWQCDGNAVYHHPAGGAESERDPHFQGYGVDHTDASGEFHFRTIRPIAYPGRTPHIHVRVQPASGRGFATQLYLPDDPGNARDFLFSRLDAQEQRALLLAIAPTANLSHPLAHATRFTATIELVVA